MIIEIGDVLGATIAVSVAIWAIGKCVESYYKLG